MGKTDVPEPWASRMVELRLVDPRYALDIPSLSALAAEADLHPSTVSAVVNGRRRATVATAKALIGVLGSDVQDWLGIHLELGPWTPPEASAQLTKSQRTALDDLIRSIAAAQTKEREDHGHQSAPIDLDARRRPPKAEPISEGDLLAGRHGRADLGPSTDGEESQEDPHQKD